MTRLRFLRRDVLASPEAGFSMVEMMVALVVIAIVMTASIAFFVNNIRGVNDQRQHQEAVYLANQQLETVESLPPSKLVKGRTQTEVQALYTTAGATALQISSQDDTSNSGNWDASATSTGNEIVPTTTTHVVNNVAYGLTTFIDVCWFSATTGTCGPTSSATTDKEYRVSVWESWTSPGSCANTCNYSTSTIIDPTNDPIFNSNISSPTGSISAPLVGGTPTVSNDNGYTNSCTTSAGTSTGTLVQVTSITNLQSSVRVRISSGGGTAADIVEVGSTEVDFCLISGDTPGTYTVTVINPDGGHFQNSILETPQVSQVSGWVPTATSTTSTLTLYGGGFESGAVVKNGASTVGTAQTVYQCSTTTTAPCTSTGSLDEVVITGFAGPTNGGTETLTVANPDSSSGTYTITAPKLGTLNPQVIITGQANTVALTGASGLLSSPNTLGAVVTNGNGTASVAYTSGSTATLTVAPAANGTVTLFLYNDNGGMTSTTNLTAITPPTVTSASPNLFLSGVSKTVTVTGTGFQTGMTATQSKTGTGASISINAATLTSTSATLTITAPSAGADTITFQNPDTGATSFTLTIDAPPVVTSKTPATVAVNVATTVTVSGTGFQSNLTAAASNGSVTVTSVSATSVVLKVTGTATGTDTITFTNPTDGGTTSFSVNVSTPPAVISETPTLVSTLVATPVTVVGTGFQSNLTAAASNGTVSVTTVTGSTAVVLSVTPSTAGTDTITLTNPTDGLSTTFTLTVDAPPTITSVTPTNPAHSAATTFTVNGTGFTSGTTLTVVYNGATVTPTTVTYSSSTKMTFKYTTNSTKGTVSLKVTATNTDGLSSSAYSTTLTQS